MPKMPESEKKEESAESREEAKEQVRFFLLLFILFQQWASSFLPGYFNLRMSFKWWQVYIIGKTEGCRSQEDREGEDWEISEAEGRCKGYQSQVQGEG